MIKILSDSRQAIAKSDGVSFAGEGNVSKINDLRQRQGTPGDPVFPGGFSYPDFFDYRSQNHSFEAMASYHDTDMTLTGRGDPVHVTGEVLWLKCFGCCA